MREMRGGGGGVSLVAAAVAELERRGRTPSVKTQTPQDTQQLVIAQHSADGERSRKSASPLSRSESFKKLRLNGTNTSSDTVTDDTKPKVSVIACQLKRSAKDDVQDVDVLYSNLMSNLEEALSSKPAPASPSCVNERDISKSARSGFSYVDLRQSSGAGGGNEVILRRNGTSQQDPDNRHSSSTTTSAATSEDFEDDSTDETGSDADSDSSATSETESSSGSDSPHLVNDSLGLETIAEEERPVTASSIRTNEEFPAPGGDVSSPDDDSTLKGHATWSGTASNHDSSSDLSTSSCDRRINKSRQGTPSERRDTIVDCSTSCNQDFQWLNKSTSNSPKMEETLVCKPPLNRNRAPRRHVSDKMAGSLDRRRPHLHQHRMERDQKSKSSHVPKSPIREQSPNHFCQNWCCNPQVPEPSFENFHRRHERMDPQRYGSSSMLLEREQQNQRNDFYHGSHPDLYSDYRYRHEMPMGCCMYHTAPPCCRCGDHRSYRWTPPPNKNSEHEDRIRRLQGENDNLQKEVFVLNERIDAQGERITELERVLQDKKQQLGNAEDLLQREMLSRSSLETQKLELMSALSEMKLAQAAVERENLELRTQCQINNNAIKKPPPSMKTRASPQPQHTSTPVLHQPPSPLTASLSQRQLASSDLHTPKTPPATYRRQVDLHYGSLPRQQFLSNGGAITLVDTNANPTPTLNGGARKGVAFGKGFTSLLGVRARGHSVPNLAETEKIIPVEEIQVPVSPSINDSSASQSPQPSPSLQPNKNRGIKKIFGRMKRSGSGNLEDLPGEGEFRRGGVRATAGPRLGWNDTSSITNSVPVLQRPDAPFSEWDNDAVCDWLQELGLDMYIQEAKKWVKNGSHLLAASAHDLEKELAIKNVLHRKKLQLALADEQGNSCDQYLAPAGRLDTAWVLRWLDDTGLPQHKDAFLANRIDGRVLHRLTIDELASLHVTSVLHVASLRRGIQILRQQNFAPGCLTRRSLPDDPAQPEPSHVALWTTHRVMEWLRAVDLAEYAPNLRGAGVHGGLMVLEPKFTAELLATLLSIPPSKTLLRRHLNTHFKELLGRDVIQEKREAETTLGYTPLTPAAKLKVTKKSQFSLKKKKDKGEQDYGDLVCPLNSTASQSGESNGSCTSRDSVGMMKIDTQKAEGVCHLIDDPALAQDDFRRNSSSPSPLPLRNVV